MSDILKRLDSLLMIEAFDTPTIRAARAEIEWLQKRLELDVEFVHAPGCTGKGISRMCAGCIEAEQLRQFAEIDRLTEIVERAKDYLDYLDGDSLETYGGQIRRDAMRAAIRAAQAAKGAQP